MQFIVVAQNAEQISIIDTKSGQIIGGMGAGAAIGTVPGGVLIANEMHSSGQLPQPTREFVVGEALGEMGSGVVQMGGGGVMTLGGAGASATGGGALVGAPVCVMGVALAANGAVTFFNGARTLIVAVCHWNELPSVEQAQPLAAAAPKDAVSGAPAPQSGGATTPATAAAAKPAQTTAAKPAPASAKPAKPAPKPSIPSGEQTPIMKPRHYGSGTKSGNTITWVRCTGQVHHAISKTIYKALQKHHTFKNVYKERDRRFVTQAIDKAAHNGYETWHRNYEKRVEAWLFANKAATPAEFEAYLFELYMTGKALHSRFPNGL